MLENKSSILKVGFILLIFSLFFPNEVNAFPPRNLIAYFEISRDNGRDYGIMPADAGLWDWPIIYKGISISTGITYRPKKIPFAFQVALLKGIPPPYKYSVSSQIYGSGSLSVIPFKNLITELSIGILYLRNINNKTYNIFDVNYHIGKYNFSAISSFFDIIKKGRIVNLNMVGGLNWKYHQVFYMTNFGKKEHSLFIGGGIFSSKWFINPYLNIVLIQQLYRQEYIEPLTYFISIGVTIQSKSNDHISNLVNKILAPKN
jgi:hypothetical protein